MYVNGSGVSQDSAKSPRKFIESSRLTRLLKINPSKCCDTPSVANRGSKFTGFDSTNNTNPARSARAVPEQPSKPTHAKRITREAIVARYRRTNCWIVGKKGRDLFLE